MGQKWEQTVMVLCSTSPTGMEGLEMATIHLCLDSRSQAGIWTRVFTNENHVLQPCQLIMYQLQEWMSLLTVMNVQFIKVVYWFWNSFCGLCCDTDSRMGEWYTA